MLLAVEKSICDKLFRKGTNQTYVNISSKFTFPVIKNIYQKPYTLFRFKLYTEAKGQNIKIDMEKIPFPKGIISISQKKGGGGSLFILFRYPIVIRKQRKVSGEKS